MTRRDKKFFVIYFIIFLFINNRFVFSFKMSIFLPISKEKRSWKLFFKTVSRNFVVTKIFFHFYFLIFGLKPSSVFAYKWWVANRLSSTIDGNRKIDQLRTTSYVSNEKRKTTCPLISWYNFPDSVKINVVFVGIRKKYLQLENR